MRMQEFKINIDRKLALDIMESPYLLWNTVISLAFNVSHSESALNVVGSSKYTETILFMFNSLNVNSSPA